MQQRNSGRNSSPKGGEEKTQRRTTNTFTNLPSYDSYFSALSYRLYNDTGVIDLSSIDPSFIGKTPKKGDQVYDHENRLSVYINAHTASSIKEAVMILQQSLEAEAEDDDDKVRAVVVNFGNEFSGARTITIYAPGRVKAKAARQPVDTEENFVVRFDITKDGETVQALHIMQNSVVTALFTKESTNEQYDQTIYTDLNLLLNFCDAVIMNACGAIRHGVGVASPRPQGGGSGASGGASGGAKNRFAAELDDEEAEEEEEEPSTRGGKRTSAKPAGTATRKALEEEFDDDVPQ